MHHVTDSQLQRKAGVEYSEILNYVSTIQPHTRHEIIAQVDARFTYIRVPFNTELSGTLLNNKAEG